MASKGPRSKLDHETRAKRQKVSCDFFSLEDYLLPFCCCCFSILAGWFCFLHAQSKNKNLDGTGKERNFNFNNPEKHIYNLWN